MFLTKSLCPFGWNNSLRNIRNSSAVFLWQERTAVHRNNTDIG